MRISILLLIVGLSACQIEEPRSEFADYGLMVELSDQKLIAIIQDYVDQTNLDSKATYLMLHIYSIGDREVIYLSHERYLYPESNEYPNFLSSFKDHLIFIYTNAAKYINNQDQINSAIKKYSKQFGIKYPQKDSFLYHPASWKLLRCESDSFEVDKYARSLRDDYAPCGYYINESGNGLDTALKKRMSREEILEMIRESREKSQKNGLE